MTNARSLDKVVSRRTIYEVIERLRESETPPAMIAVEKDLNDFVDERILMVIGRLACSSNAEALPPSLVRSLFGDLKETVVIAVESVVEEYRSLLKEFMPSPEVLETRGTQTPPASEGQSEESLDGQQIDPS